MCDCNEQINNSLPGNNAYTKVKSQFTVPAVGSNVTINVLSYSPFTGEWASPGQIIFIENAGYYEVISSSDTQIVAKNLGYLGNALAGTIIIVNSGISPGGIPGINTTNTVRPSGVIDQTFITISSGGSNTLVNKDILLPIIGDTVEIYTVLSAVNTITLDGELVELDLELDNGSILKVDAVNNGLNLSPNEKKGNFVIKSTITRISSTQIVHQTEGYFALSTLQANPLQILGFVSSNNNGEETTFFSNETITNNQINIKIKAETDAINSNALFFSVIKFIPKI